jgi:heat shock protein HslJ
LTYSHAIKTWKYVKTSCGEDGQVSGTAGCNNHFASYEADAEADSITMGEVGSTMITCAEPEGIME